MSGKRITWIDNAKIIAGLLMILDHALLYFGYEGSCLRYTITRCVEPLYVFCFAYLLSVKGRNLSPKRWKQLAIAAIIETAIHSHRAGILYFGILANLTCFGWLVEALRRMSNPSLVILAVMSSALAIIPLSGEAFYIDYGPSLLVSQFSFAILAPRLTNSLAITLATSWFATLLACGCLVMADVQPSPTIWTILIGHPLAASILRCSARLPVDRFHRESVILLHPLSFYVGHLSVMHLAKILW